MSLDIQHEAAQQSYPYRYNVCYGTDSAGMPASLSLSVFHEVLRILGPHQPAARRRRCGKPDQIHEALELISALAGVQIASSNQSQHVPAVAISSVRPEARKSHNLQCRDSKALALRQNMQLASNRRV